MTIRHEGSYLFVLPEPAPEPICPLLRDTRWFPALNLTGNRGGHRRRLAAGLFGYDLQLRQAGVAIDIMQDRKQFAGEARVVHLVHRIGLPVVRRAARVGKSDRM